MGASFNVRGWLNEGRCGGNLAWRWGRLYRATRGSPQRRWQLAWRCQPTASLDSPGRTEGDGIGLWVAASRHGSGGRELRSGSRAGVRCSRRVALICRSQRMSVTTSTKSRQRHSAPMRGSSAKQHRGRGATKQTTVGPGRTAVVVDRHPVRAGCTRSRPAVDASRRCTTATSRSRNASHPAPPPQIRACGATAHGSCLGW